MINLNLIFENLNDLYKRSPCIGLKSYKKYVIFSDLHMGDGGRNDDFLENSNLVMHILKEYYLKK